MTHGTWSRWTAWMRKDRESPFTFLPSHSTGSDIFVRVRVDSDPAAPGRRSSPEITDCKPTSSMDDKIDALTVHRGTAGHRLATRYTRDQTRRHFSRPLTYTPEFMA